MVVGRVLLVGYCCDIGMVLVWHWYGMACICMAWYGVGMVMLWYWYGIGLVLVCYWYGVCMEVFLCYWSGMHVCM